jgi:hypothetical protein
MPKLTIRSPSKGGQQQPHQPGGSETTTSLFAGQLHHTPTNLPVCLIDNGGWTVKYGLLAPSPNSDTDNNDGSIGELTQMQSMYNATARPPAQLTVLAGDEITNRMKNLGQLSWNMACERGMVCNGETQLRVWARTLECLNVVPVPNIGIHSFLNTMATNRKKTIKPVGVTASTVKVFLIIIIMQLAMVKMSILATITATITTTMTCLNCGLMIEQIAAVW